MAEVSPVSFWRRGRDSNPRDGGNPPNGFRDRRIQPLCHLSAVARAARAATSATASIPRGHGHGNAGWGISTLSSESVRLASEPAPGSPLMLAGRRLRMGKAAGLSWVTASRGASGRPWRHSATSGRRRESEPIPPEARCERPRPTTSLPGAAPSRFSSPTCAVTPHSRSSSIPRSCAK